MAQRRNKTKKAADETSQPWLGSVDSTRALVALTVAGGLLTGVAIYVAYFVGNQWFFPSFALIAVVLLPLYLRVFGTRSKGSDEAGMLEQRTKSVRELRAVYDKELEDLRRTSRTINVSAHSGGVVNMSDLTPLTTALAVEESRVLADDFRRLAERERRAAFAHRAVALLVIAIGGYFVHQDLAEADRFSALLVTRKLTIGIPTAVLFAWVQRLAHEHFMISDWASRVAVQLAPIGSVTLLLGDQADRNAVIRTFLTNVFVGAPQPTTRTRSKGAVSAGVTTPVLSGNFDMAQDYATGNAYRQMASAGPAPTQPAQGANPTE